jgi:hypothetical protein
MKRGVNLWKKRHIRIQRDVLSPEEHVRRSMTKSVQLACPTCRCNRNEENRLPSKMLIRSKANRLKWRPLKSTQNDFQVPRRNQHPRNALRLHETLHPKHDCRVKTHRMPINRVLTSSDSCNVAFDSVNTLTVHQ